MRPNWLRSSGNCSGACVPAPAITTTGNTHHDPDEHRHAFARPHGDRYCFPVANGHSHLNPDADAHAPSGLVRQRSAG